MVLRSIPDSGMEFDRGCNQVLYAALWNTVWHIFNWSAVWLFLFESVTVHLTWFVFLAAVLCSLDLGHVVFEIEGLWGWECSRLLVHTDKISRLSQKIFLKDQMVNDLSLFLFEAKVWISKPSHSHVCSVWVNRYVIVYTCINNL